MSKFVITSRNPDIGYESLAKAIEKKLSENGYCEVSLRDSKRKLAANAQQHVWYQQIAGETGESVATVACRCKRDYGLPIILQDDDVGVVMSWQLDKIGFESMTDERQLKVMSVFSVTSLMSGKQHSQFRDNMQNGWREKGIYLEYL